VKNRPTDQWLRGYITSGDGVLKEPTVRTTWAVPKADRTARIARSGKRTVRARPRHRNGRSGFSLRGWTRIYPRMDLPKNVSSRFYQFSHLSEKSFFPYFHFLDRYSGESENHYEIFPGLTYQWFGCTNFPLFSLFREGSIHASVPP
jgi:hypothetical protein